MANPQKIEISPEEAVIVLAILQAHVPDRPVWAFGSRTNGKARRRSDLDLAVGGDEPLSLRTRSQLAEDFDQSDLPYRVDVVDLADITPEFRQRIERDFILIHAGVSVAQAVNA